MGVTLINIKRINFTLFNAYKKYKVLIKVKDEDSAITVSTEMGLSGCYQLNSIQIQKVYEKYVYFISISLTF